MSSFEDICREFEKKEEEAERDLYALLKCLSRNVLLDLPDKDYKIALLFFLQKKQHINREGNSGTVTSYGQKAIKRGWVEINIKEYNRKKYRKLAYNLAMLILSAVAAIASVISLIGN